MKLILAALFANSLLFSAAPAQSAITVTVDARFPCQPVPDDFCGSSFGAVAELPDRGGVSGFLFSPTNSQLIALFTNSGIRNLRLGGSTVEGLKAARPSRAAIDNVFGFAQAAGLKVIYSLPLLNGNPADDAATAKYISDRYQPLLECFAIGNEPDIKRYHYPPFGSGTDPAITNYASYLVQWKKFATAITHAVPDAKFAGPDAASGGKNGKGWASQFAADEKGSGLVVLATQHLYIGGSPFIGPNDDKRLRIPVAEAIDTMLSPDYPAKRYPSFFLQTLMPVVAKGMPYRMTESDDCLKGVPGGSDAFASALWGLDYLHWWALHGASGVDFHNTEWLKTDTVYFDPDSGSYRINPKAYAIRAFDLGSRGRVESFMVDNRDNLNLTAYAIGGAANLFVTIINKEHGADARSATVTIALQGFSAREAKVMFLTSLGGDVAAKDGITLGGAPILNHGAWRGQWTPLKTDPTRCVVGVPAASAAIVKLSSG